MNKKSEGRRLLNADSWIEAALDAIAEGGPEEVAVEPLARVLGVTKGSFYWHFPNRDALLAAALQAWEIEQIAVTQTPDAQNAGPRERLHAMIHRIANTGDRTERIMRRVASSSHPLAKASEQRVTRSWTDYMIGCYRALGYDEATCRNWATFSYATFIGTFQLRWDHPDALPQGEAFSDYLRFLISSLMPPSTSMGAGRNLPPRRPAESVQ